MILNLKNLKILKKKGFNIKNKREFRKGVVEFDNQFEDCYLCDITFTNFDEVYDFIVELNSIYVNLSDEENSKNIYLNLDYASKCIIVLYEKNCLAFPEPINKYLGFYHERLYGGSKEDAMYDYLGASVGDMIKMRDDYIGHRLTILN